MVKIRISLANLFTTRKTHRTCVRCNGFGGHFDGHDFQECATCWGEGEVPRW